MHFFIDSTEITEINKGKQYRLSSLLEIVLFINSCDDSIFIDLDATLDTNSNLVSPIYSTMMVLNSIYNSNNLNEILKILAKKVKL